MQKYLFLRAKPWQTLIRLYESLVTTLKFQCLRSSGLDSLKFELQCLRQSELNVLTLELDWASPETLTTTPSSLEYILLTSIKEDLCLLSHLLTFN